MFSIGTDEIYERLESCTPEMLADLQAEFDHCRNALLVLLDGNEAAVKDAYSEALTERDLFGEWYY